MVAYPFRIVALGNLLQGKEEEHYHDLDHGPSFEASLGMVLGEAFLHQDTWGTACEVDQQEIWAFHGRHEQLPIELF